MTVLAVTACVDAIPLASQRDNRSNQSMLGRGVGFLYLLSILKVRTSLLVLSGVVETKIPSVSTD